MFTSGLSLTRGVYNGFQEMPQQNLFLTHVSCRFDSSPEASVIPGICYSARHEGET